MADYINWPDMLVLLANEAGMSQGSLENVHALTTIEWRRLVAGNPVSVARHFSHKFAGFVKHFLKGMKEAYFWQMHEIWLG